MLYAILLLTLAFDMSALKSETNPEKRSEMALTNANHALDAARDDYDAGDYNKSVTELEEVGDSVDLAYQSLADSGKDPRKDPKFFKRAEMRTRELLRRLEDLAPRLSGPDQGTLEKVRARISEVHDNLLKGIMTRKKN